MVFSIFNLFEKKNEGLKASDRIAFIYSPQYNLALEAHVFPAHKFASLHDFLAMDEELCDVPFFDPEPATKENLLLVHTEELLDDLEELKYSYRTKRSELPLTHTLIENFKYGVGGTILAMQKTKEYKFVFNTGGGFHHSYPDHAEGFCYLNDVAVATRVYQKENPGKKVLILDLDLHQGNGNSFIFQQDDTVFTFSMHQENLYPVKEKSDLDIPLYDGCEDTEYLSELKRALHKLKNFQPDLIFYLAGADPFEGDKLGSLRLSFKGLQERDRIVKAFAEEMKCPVVIVTAGGYAVNFQDTVKIHYNTARVFAIDT
ncbi:MAG: histone deacetylase [Leptospiraceae bacterium]|nr:histone deacetylase [Leptospiraceae bacterium]